MSEKAPGESGVPRSAEAEPSRAGASLRCTVAVTGATGLVGFNLVKYLAGRGYPVIAIARDPAGAKAQALASAVGSAAVELVRGDVLDKESLAGAFAGAEVVVHAAGSVDPFGKREEIFATNVGGTGNALAAAASCGVKQFIHISSLSVITGQGDQYDVDESAPLKPCGEAYADSKVEAERLAMAGRSDDMKVTVLRPGFIYGPGERAWLPRLIASIKGGKAMLIDGGSKETNVIYVGNLNLAVTGAMLNPVAFGRVYNLTDGAHVTKKELFDAIADGLGLSRVEKKIPGAIARGVCELVSTVAPALPVSTQRSLARYSRGAFRLAGVNQGFSIKRAEAELGYTEAVRVPFQEGMKITLESFKPVG